jgi:ACS family tartrate transporter-like MFS transporter
MTTDRDVARKVLWRLVLPLALVSVVGSIDRANVGFAALQMNDALGLSAAQYGFGAGVLFVGFLVSKLPSVLLLERIGMRRWLAVISFGWGVGATAMAFIDSALTFYLLRFAIGIAEGGLSSGIMLYLANWASQRQLAAVLAIPMVSVPVAQVIGGPLSGLLLDNPNPLNWEGWRWMFLVEGMPAILIAIWALFHFPDGPKEARWLTAVERDWIAANANPRRPGDDPGGERWSALANPLTWLCGTIWLCALAGNYGVIFWLPQVITSLAGLTPTQTGLVVALPWIANAIGILVNARLSDRAGERFVHLAVPFVGAGLALVIAYMAGGGLLGLVALIAAGFCLGAVTSPFWAIPASLLAPGARAIGFVTINVLGSFAGLTVPGVMGMLRDATGTFAASTFLLAGILFVGAAMALLTRAVAARRAVPASA